MHKGIMQQLFIQIAQDYKNLRKNIQALLDNKDNQSAINYLQSQLLQNSLFAEAQKQIQTCNDNIEGIIKMFQQFLFSKLNNEKTVTNVHKLINKLGNDIQIINTKKAQSLNNDINKLEKDFAYLLSPSKLPSAYNQAIKEISRRNEFRDYSKLKIQKLTSLFKIEYEKRKQFLQQYGKILPTEFIPQLRNFPASIQVNDEKNDNDYPGITGEHDPNEGYMKKKKENQIDKIKNLEALNESQANQIQWLSQELKQKETEYKLKFSKELRMDGLLGKNEQQKIICLQEEVDSLNELVLKTHDYYKDKKSKIIEKENCSSKETYQLTMKVRSLTELLQDTAKQQFNIYARKVQDQQTIKDKLSQQLTMKQELLDKQKNEMTLYFEDKINKQIIEKNNLEAKLSEQLEIQTQVEEVNQQQSETIKQLSKQIEELKQDIASKLDQINTSEARIKSLNDIKNSQLREINELKDKGIRFEQKMKLEHSDVISNIHNINKQEQQKLIGRVNSLELDLANKQQEIDKLNGVVQSKQKECNEQQQLVESISRKLETQIELVQSNKEAMKQLQTNLANQEIINEQKTQENNEILKQKKQIEGHNMQLIQQSQEYASKLSQKEQKIQNQLQSNNDMQQQYNTQKLKIEALEHEIEKKTIELTSQTKQLQVFMHEKQANKQAEINEQQELIEQLTNANNEKQFKIASLETEIQIKEIDFQTKLKEYEAMQKQFNESNSYLQKANGQLDLLKQENGEQKQQIQNIQYSLENNTSIQDQLNMEKELLKQQNRTLEENISKQETENLQLQQKLLTAEETIKQLKLQIPMIATEKEQNQNKFSQLESDHAELQIQIKQLKDDIIALKQELEQKQQREIKYQGQICDYEDSTKTLLEVQTQNQTLIKQLEEQEIIYQDQIKKYKEKIDSLQQELTTLTTQFHNAKQDYEDKFSSLTLQNNQSQILINQKILEMSELQENNYNKQMTLTIQKSNNIETSERIRKSEKEVQGILGELEQLLEIKQDKKIEQLNKQIIEQDEQLKNTVKLLGSYEQQITNLKQQMRKLEDQISQSSMDPSENAFALTSQNFDQIIANPSTDTTLYIKNMNFKGLGKLNYFEFLNFQSQLIEKEKISLNSLNVGERLLFIPFSEGIYVPLLFMENQQKQFNKFQSINSQAQFNYLLDYQNLSEKYKALLNECTFLVVAKIQKIDFKSTLTEQEKTKYKLTGKDEVILIQIETPEYMVGFEEDNYRLIKY